MIWEIENIKICKLGLFLKEAHQVGIPCQVAVESTEFGLTVIENPCVVESEVVVQVYAEMQKFNGSPKCHCD